VSGRGAERQREAGAGPKHDLVFTDRLLVTLVHQRTGLPHPALRGYLRYRFLLNCTCLQINRLGLGPYHRLRTCHAAANAVEEIYGLSAIDGIRGFVERHPSWTALDPTLGGRPGVRALSAARVTGRLPVDVLMQGR
jgi:hypothetical protein